MKNIKALLFDVDGVLIDSTAANAAFYRELFRQIGGTQPDEHLLRSGMHLSVEAMLRKVFPERSNEDIYRWMVQADIIDAGFELLRPMPGVLETLPKLQDYTLGLVTNRTVAGIEELWQVLPFRHLFSAAAAYEYTHRHKPDPEPIRFVLNKLNVQPGVTVFIGDAETDVQAGRAAGVKVIIFGQQQWPGVIATISTLSELPMVLGR